MHKKKDCALKKLHTLKISKNIIIYYLRIRKFDKEKNTLKSRKIRTK